MAPVASFVRDLLDGMPLWQAALVLFAQNVVVFGAALAFGGALIRAFGTLRVTPPAPPIERLELGLACSTVVLNSAITFAGLWLYRAGFIRLRHDLGGMALVDVVVLLLGMDAAMYALHRVAHAPPLFGWLHAPHHRYPHPRPLTLFVLHPFETLSFGALWLGVLWLYTVLADGASWLGIALYLTLNLAFGVVGHLGVEPFGAAVDGAWLRWIGTSRFHARHHLDPSHNFGFYTAVWDRVFGTSHVSPQPALAKPRLSK